MRLDPWFVSRERYRAFLFAAFKVLGRRPRDYRSAASFRRAVALTASACYRDAAQKERELLQVAEAAVATVAP